jgi:hypothetical protein
MDALSESRNAKKSGQGLAPADSVRDTMVLVRGCGGRGDVGEFFVLADYSD